MHEHVAQAVFNATDLEMLTILQPHNDVRNLAQRMKPEVQIHHLRQRDTLNRALDHSGTCSETDSAVGQTSVKGKSRLTPNQEKSGSQQFGKV